MDERRQDLRGEVAFEIKYQTAQEFLSAYSGNISGGGIFIRTEEPLPLNHEVRIRFTLPGMNHQFDCRGIIVWANPSSRQSFLPSGMGIKFVDMDEAARKLINEFVQKSAGPGGQHRP
jgi:uncharacterized protein (TIGR02266 family)